LVAMKRAVGRKAINHLMPLQVKILDHADHCLRGKESRQILEDLTEEYLQRLGQ